MARKRGFESLDRSLKDIRNNNEVMRGVTVLLTGDFRQILPVIPRGSRADEVKAYIKASYLWLLIEQLSLNKNMRVQLGGDVTAGKFSELQLKIGNGDFPELAGKLVITKSLCLVVTTLQELIVQNYPDIADIKNKSMDWLCERVILTPKNERATYPFNMPSNRGRGSPQTRNLQHAPRKRTNEAPLTPPFQSKNKFTPLQNIDDETDQDGISTNDNAQDAQVSPKIPPIYVYNISNYETFHTSLSNQTFDDFSVTHTKNSLKLNLSSIEDYRSITKSFNESEIQYHTYQFQTEKQLSVVIRNLPIPITEERIFNELKELNFDVDTVTRLQNRYKNPIPIVAVLLKKSSPNIYSLNRLLHCVVSIEPRKPSTGIPQCANCQRFSHTKKFCHLPPRCVKCAGDHHYTQCQKTLETPAKCVNCNGDHPASYRGCTFYKDITKNKNKIVANPRQNNNYSNAIPKLANQHVLNNKDNTNNLYTYASACKNNSNSNSTNNADSDNGFMKTLLPLINTFITQLMQKIIENLPVIINSLNQNTHGSP
ncbi:hypothetical protein QTP88_028187 [Uroleucon formosanum]